MKNYVKVFNNFILEEDCDALITHLNTLKKQNKLMLRGDGRFCAENLKEKVFLDMVEKYYEKVMMEVSNEYACIFGFILSIYYEGVGMGPHVDSLEGEEVGALFYLNDEYLGGELSVETPEGAFIYKPKKGDLVYFPSWFTHSVFPVQKGVRYFFTVSLLKNPPSKTG